MKNNFENIDLEKTESSFKSEKEKSMKPCLINDSVLLAVFKILYKDLKTEALKGNWIEFPPSGVTIWSKRKIDRQPRSGARDIPEAFRRLAATLYHLAAGQSEWNSPIVDQYDYHPIDSHLWPLMEKMLSGELRSWVQLDKLANSLGLIWSVNRCGRFVRKQTLKAFTYGLILFVKVAKFIWSLPKMLYQSIQDLRQKDYSDMMRSKVADVVLLPFLFADIFLIVVSPVCTGFHNGFSFGLLWFAGYIILSLWLFNWAYIDEDHNGGLLLIFPALFVLGIWVSGWYLPSQFVSRYAPTTEQSKPEIIINRTSKNFVAQAPNSRYDFLPYIVYRDPIAYEIREGIVPYGSSGFLAKTLKTTNLRLEASFGIGTAEDYATAWTEYLTAGDLNLAIERALKEVLNSEEETMMALLNEYTEICDPTLDYAAVEARLAAIDEEFANDYVKAVVASNFQISNGKLDNLLAQSSWQKQKARTQISKVEETNRNAALPQLSRLVETKLHEYFPYLNISVLVRIVN